MLERLRGVWTKIITPACRLLLRLHVSADMVTWVGTIASVAIALWFFPQGMLWQGTLILLVFIFSDSFDGTMARLSGTVSKWGAFLDSTLDRINDGAVFGALAMYYAGPGNSPTWAGVGIIALVFGQVTSYSKARGEAIGYVVKGGLAGRADRLAIGLLGALLTGFGVSWALPTAMIVLVVTGFITVGQRMLMVYRQALRQDATAPDTDA